MMNNKLLVRWSHDFRRMGSLEALFVTTQEELDEYYGREVYFGEVLGKHSDIAARFKKEDVTILSEDQEKIEWLLSICSPLDKTTISGYNPIAYIKDAEEQDTEIGPYAYDREE